MFPDEGHGFVRPINTEQFLAKHLGGRALPPKAEHDWKAFLK